MAEVNYLPHCCGITELGYIRDDKSPVDSLMAFSQGNIGAHVVFSVTSRECKKHKKGITLASYIRKHNLGAVVSTKGAVNPNHQGTLRAWIWTPNKAALWKWQVAEKKAH